jgi:hypothetical protein
MECIKGYLHNIGAKKVFKSNAVLIDFIVSRINGSAYPNVVFEALGDEMIAKVLAIPPNTMVAVEYEIQGKSFTGKDGLPKHFNTLRALNIVIVNDTVDSIPAETTLVVVDQTVVEEKTN